jgi:hypothetical protein
MAQRLVTIQVTAKLNIGVYLSSTNYIQQMVFNALVSDGWQIVNISVNAFLDTYNITITANVDNAYNDGYVKTRCQQVLSGIVTRINYGVTTGADFNLFSSVVVYILTNVPIYQDATQAQNLQGFLYDQFGIDSQKLQKNFSLGLGIGTPVIIAGAVVLALIYLKR